MTWRYLAERLHGDGTGTVLDTEVPLNDVEITDVLSGPDRLTATISPELRRLVGPDGMPLFQPWSTAIYAEADGQIRSGAILVAADVDGPGFRLDCMGFSGYPQGLPWVGPSMPYEQGVEADPMDLFRTIWTHVQGKPDGDLGLVVDSTTSPVVIGYELEQVEFDTREGPVSFEAGPYKLDEWSTDNLGAKLDELAASTPFDYDEEHRWNSDRSAVLHRLRLHYPAKGRRRHDLRFVIGENVQVVPAVSDTGEEYASEVLLLGAGEGRDMIRATSGRRTGRLRRARVVTDKTIRSKTKASAAARDEVKWRSGASYEFEQVVVSDWAKLGAQTGDEIRVQGEIDWVDVDQWGRVLEVSYSPEGGDAATVTLEPARVA